jgi:hypothetical protein
MFAGMACAALNFGAGQALSALRSDDESQKEFATSNVTNFLRHPLTPASLQRVLDAVAP